MPGANRVMIDVTASTMNESNPLKLVRAIRSSIKQTAYSTRYFPAVLKRRSDKIRAKGTRLRHGLTMFIIPSLLVLNISVVIVSSRMSFVQGSSRIPFLYSVVDEKDSPFITQCPLYQNAFSEAPYLKVRPGSQK